MASAPKQLEIQDTGASAEADRAAGLRPQPATQSPQSSIASAVPLCVVKRGDMAPQQYEIRSRYDDLPGEWCDIYVNFSGFFGSYNPEMFAAAPEMAEVLQTLRDYVSDTASGALAYRNGGDNQPGLRAMAKDDLANIDALLAKIGGAS